MNSWVQVVTHPLGLAGFALFLVFSFLGRMKKKPDWFPIGAYAMAILALVGGLFIAYRQESPSPVAAADQQIGSIQQTQIGTGANVADVKGPVTVTVTAPPVVPPPSPPSLTQDKVKSLLASGIGEALIVQAIREQGIAFQMTSELANSFRSLGASDAVIAALEKSTRR
jgi:hypothetical protein